MDTFDKSLQIHSASKGKLSVESKLKLDNHDDLSLVYTPGVAAVSKAIQKDPSNLREMTIKANTVAVITNGTAVLGLGDIGPEAALPVMEGKCMLFKRFAGINAFPLCIDSKDPDEFINIVKKITIPFAGINLEDIAAPACFEIEQRLINELDIPVFHDDQHGTAIVTLAGLINALKVVNKSADNVKVVILGAGAAGTAIAKLLSNFGFLNMIVCDRNGIISTNRENIKSNKNKLELASITNKDNVDGSLTDALVGADVFIGVSGPGLLSIEMIRGMNEKPIVFAMANPIPEIIPDEAKEAGVAVYGTGRSDFPNQINNVLAFPGIFKGAIDAGIKNINIKMMIAAAESLAGLIEIPTAEKIIADIFDERIVESVAEAVKNNVL